MLKFYLTTLLSSTILMVFAMIRVLSNKKIRDFARQYSKEKKKVSKIIVSTLQLQLYNFIPLYNIMMAMVYIFYMCASDDSIIKLLKKREDEIQEEVINEYIKSKKQSVDN